MLLQVPQLFHDERRVSANDDRGTVCNNTQCKTDWGSYHYLKAWDLLAKSVASTPFTPLRIVMYDDTNPET